MTPSPNLPGDPSLPPGTTDADLDGPIERCIVCGWQLRVNDYPDGVCPRCQAREDSDS